MKLIKTTKFIYLLTLCLALGTVKAQVGIDTSDPKATLDVVGSPTEPTILDGIIPPRITGDQLQSKNYTQDQNGALVYVTSATTNPSGQTINVRGEGLYSFNANKNVWVAMNSHMSIGERVNVHTTMAVSAQVDTRLPDSEMIELEGVIRVGLLKVNNTFYKPYIENITSAPISVTFASGFEGRTDEVDNEVNFAMEPDTILGIDRTDQAYWDDETEILTGNVILPSGSMYEIQWMAYEDDATPPSKQIYMTAFKKF